MPKPGLLYVSARFTNPGLSDEAFNKWYDGEHIPQVLTLSGVRAVVRYVKMDSGDDTPYLALWSVHDTAWLHSEEMFAMQDSTKSDLLPEGNALKCVDFGARFYEHIQTYELPGAKSDPAAYAFLVAMEPGPGSDQDFNDWFQRQHLDMLSMCNGYVRTILFKLEQEQPRTDPSKPSTVPPSYLAVHEFETLDSMDHKQFQRTQETEWAKRILDKAERVEISSYKLLSAFGYGVSD